MKQQNRWILVVLVGCLMGNWFLGPLERLHAAPSSEKSSKEVLVNVNEASLPELETIRGIGPMLAERIVKDREANGRFEHLEDLIRVPGIGQAKLEKIKSQITV